ncbi:SRPBCC domain-containing protein [Salegentibacter chungangensis]|uniref:SRPBCC domain-containing protein n=1 Tax=Salegentibacter chungangensis TaxID=1335724 RepID=A0ABW3NQK0_9FLAO
MKQLEIETALQILKPKKEVFEAIADPDKMSNYFIERGSGRIEEGKEIEWKFPEFDESFFIKVLEVRPGEYIAYEWEGAKGRMLKVEINLEDLSGNTLVKIKEGTMENDEEGIKWYGMNTGGWANFLASLKAYLEYGINLRKGAFDFMKK